MDAEIFGTESGGTGDQVAGRCAVHDVAAVEVGVDVLHDAGDPHLRDDVVVRVGVVGAGALGGLQPALDRRPGPLGAGASGFGDQPRTTGMALSPTCTGVTTQ